MTARVKASPKRPEHHASAGTSMSAHWARSAGLAFARRGNWRASCQPAWAASRQPITPACTIANPLGT